MTFDYVPGGPFRHTHIKVSMNEHSRACNKHTILGRMEECIATFYDKYSGILV